MAVRFGSGLGVGAGAGGVVIISFMKLASQKT